MLPKPACIFIVFCLAFLVLPFRSFSQDQELGFKKISIEQNGIPFNQFAAIIQDREGFLWLSTREELLKYDGYEAKVYKNNPEDSTSLGNNNVRKLYVDAQGDLWAGHKKGLSRYRKSCDCFVNYPLVSPFRSARIDSIFQENLLRTTQTSVFAITEDQNKQLWLGTLLSGGLYKMDTYAKKFTWYASLKRAQRSFESKTAAGIFWISSMGEGLRRLDTKTGLIKNYFHPFYSAAGGQKIIDFHPAHHFRNCLPGRL